MRLERYYLKDKDLINDKLFLLCSRADRWFLLNNADSTPRAYHGLVAVGQYVYMIGGFDGQEHFSTVKRLDPVTQVWEERSCMLSPRCYVSCCELSRSPLMVTC